MSRKEDEAFRNRIAEARETEKKRKNNLAKQMKQMQQKAATLREEAKHHDFLAIQAENKAEECKKEARKYSQQVALHEQATKQALMLEQEKKDAAIKYEKKAIEERRIAEYYNRDAAKKDAEKKELQNVRKKNSLKEDFYLAPELFCEAIIPVIKRYLKSTLHIQKADFVIDFPPDTMQPLEINKKKIALEDVVIIKYRSDNELFAEILSV